LAKVLRATVERIPQMIQLGWLRAQTGFDVAQALAISQLRERHAQELIQAGERLHLPFARIAADDSTKGVQRQMLDLCEDQLARVHSLPPRWIPSQGRKPCFRGSSR
jgi:hypothetical protein